MALLECQCGFVEKFSGDMDEHWCGYKGKPNLEERIAELEGQVKASEKVLFEAGVSMGSLSKREAVLRKALEWYADKENWVQRYDARISSTGKDCGAKARAALEAK